MAGNARVAVAHPIDRAVIVIGNQHRAILEGQHVDRTSDVVVVLDEPGDERIERLNAAVAIELRNHDIAADLRRVDDVPFYGSVSGLMPA